MNALATPDDAEVERALTAARVNLLVDQPFLGALAMHLQFEAADPRWCPSTATDARKLYYNPEYILQLSGPERVFTLGHEALHCGLGHLWRRAGRRVERWDIACDYAVNMALDGTGLVAPPNALRMDEYADLSAEEIYPLIDENPLQETLDRHIHGESSGQVSGNGDASPPPPSDQTLRETVGESSASDNASQSLQELWRSRVAGAAEQAARGEGLSGPLARLVEQMLAPPLPWRTLLARFMQALARDDWSYARPSSRRGDPAILPGLRSASLDLVVALDTSASIGADELSRFCTELDALKSSASTRVTLLACDAALDERCPWVFEPWEAVQLPPDLSGGGSTRFEPVFDWVASLDMPPDALVYLTDGLGSFPAAPPAFPVLWVLAGPASVPFGQRANWE